MKNPFKKQRNDYDSYDDSYDNGFYRERDEEEDGVVGGDDFEEEAATLPPVPTAKRPTAGKSSRVKVVKPQGYQDGPAIADYLVDGYTVVMNIEALERTATLRLIDFLLGALHVLGGELRRVTKTTLLLCPRPDEIAIDELGEDEGEIVDEI